MRRHRLVIGAAIVLLLLVAGAVLVLARHVDSYRGQVQGVLAERLGRKVSGSS